MKGAFGTWFGWGAAILMIATIITGLLIIGGPGKARAKKQDIARLEALQKTARAIACYGQNIGPLPADAAAIKSATENERSKIHDNKSCGNLTWDTDPISGVEFEYNRAGDEEFELCANFATADTISQDNYYYRYGGDNGGLIGTEKPRPSIGRHCYLGRLFDENE